MDCEHRDQLLDLVYGELGDAEATVLRRRAEACEGCRDELARLDEVKRLADQLVVEPMPLTAHNLILAAAREAAAKNAEVAKEEPGFWAGVLAWIQATAAKPQLAMALVMLGVVAVGVYFVPGDELAQHEIETSIVADPETVAADESHEPLEALEEDGEADLAREAEAEQQADHEQAEDLDAQQQEVQPDRDPPRDDRRARTTTETSRTAMTTAMTRTVRAPTSAEIAAARQEGENAQIERTMLDLAEVRPEEEGSVAESMQLEALEPQPVPDQPQTRQQTQTQTRTREPTTRPASERPVTEMATSTNTIEPMRGNRATYERAMSEYRGGDYRSAAQEFERVVRSPADDVRELLPSAQHHLARSHRSRGACSTALRHYTLLFERYPAYAQVPQALLEAADCHRREGNLSAARTLLYRAAGYASTEASAQRELRRIETLQRAQRRSAPAPAQADSVESAY